MNNPIVYTITELDSINARIYTTDDRVADCDKEILICNGNLLSMMHIITNLLADDGYSVVFEVN